MGLATEYQAQWAWRDWSTPLALCPIETGQRVLDLGCGIGDLSRALYQRGAIVTGIDANADLLSVARRDPTLSACEFYKQNLAALDLKKEYYDGLWCSFTAAYLVPFEETFGRWSAHLADPSWVCLIEVDDLFGHEPLEQRTRQLIESYYEESLKARRYDFRAGRKLSATLTKHGFDVVERDLVDQELSFSGPASSRVVEAWSSRLDRMGGLKTFLGRGFADFRSDFLACLRAPEHRSICRVVMTVAKKVPGTF